MVKGEDRGMTGIRYTVPGIPMRMAPIVVFGLLLTGCSKPVCDEGNLLSNEKKLFELYAIPQMSGCIPFAYGIDSH